jgi:hypothetical protein
MGNNGDNSAGPTGGKLRAIYFGDRALQGYKAIKTISWHQPATIFFLFPAQSVCENTWRLPDIDTVTGSR